MASNSIDSGIGAAESIDGWMVMMERLGKRWTKGRMSDHCRYISESAGGLNEVFEMLRGMKWRSETPKGQSKLICGKMAVLA